MHHEAHVHRNLLWDDRELLHDWILLEMCKVLLLDVEGTWVIEFEWGLLLKRLFSIHLELTQGRI